MSGLRRALPLGIVFVALVAAATGAWVWRDQESPGPTTTLTLYGNVDIRQVELAFSVRERIAEMRVEEGDRVRRGRVLATVNRARFQQAVARAKARVEAQRQVVARLEAGSRPEEIRQARAEVEAARAQARNARQTYERLKGLAQRQLASQEQADNAQAAFDAAEARLEANRQALNLALAGARKEDIAAARATLRAERAALSLARRDLHDTALRAPADGIIRDRILEPGDMGSPERPVYTLALTDPAWVRAYVPEPDLGRIRPGLAAQVQTDTYPDKRYTAWVGAVSPTAEFTPKSVQTPEIRTDLVYQVRIHVCNPRQELRLGMPVTVTIPLDAARSDPTPSPSEPCGRRDGPQ